MAFDLKQALEDLRLDLDVDDFSEDSDLVSDNDASSMERMDAFLSVVREEGSSPDLIHFAYHAGLLNSTGLQYVSLENLGVIDIKMALEDLEEQQEARKKSFLSRAVDRIKTFFSSVLDNIKKIAKTTASAARAKISDTVSFVKAHPYKTAAAVLATATAAVAGYALIKKTNEEYLRNKKEHNDKIDQDISHLKASNEASERLIKQWKDRALSDSEFRKMPYPKGLLAFQDRAIDHAVASVNLSADKIDETQARIRELDKNKLQNGWTKDNAKQFIHAAGEVFAKFADNISDILRHSWEWIKTVADGGVTAAVKYAHAIYHYVSSMRVGVIRELLTTVRTLIRSIWGRSQSVG